MSDLEREAKKYSEIYSSFGWNSLVMQYVEQAYLAGAQPRQKKLEAVRERLKTHWLATLSCNTESHTDIAGCACGLWNSGQCKSVGEAIERWIDHAILDAKE